MYKSSISVRIKYSIAYTNARDDLPNIIMFITLYS